MANVKTESRNGRKRIKKSALIIVFGSLLIFAGIVFGILNLVLNQVNGREDTKLTEQIDKAGLEIEKGGFEHMSEEDVQETIHKMSHQKIIASQKWGAIRMTKDRISTMILVVEQNREHLEHSELYMEILNRWAEGDFSRADQDHNEIWELQDGTEGFATGTATAEEEQEYIENTFKDSDIVD